MLIKNKFQVTEGDELVSGGDAGAGQGGPKGSAEAPRGRAGNGEVEEAQQERAHSPRGPAAGNNPQAGGLSYSRIKIILEDHCNPNLFSLNIL